MTKWEYRIVTLNPSSYDLSSEEKLNIFGEDGWELVTVVVSDHIWTCFFKRPLNPTPDKVPNLIHTGAEEYPVEDGNDGC